MSGEPESEAPEAPELAACPWCGGRAEHFGGGGHHCVRCSACGRTNERLVLPEGYYEGFPTASVHDRELLGGDDWMLYIVDTERLEDFYSIYDEFSECGLRECCPGIMYPSLENGMFPNVELHEEVRQADFMGYFQMVDEGRWIGEYD